MRHAAKRDGNERGIVLALELAGWSVWKMSQPGFPDLLCVRRGEVVLIEVKEVGKRDHLTEKQAEVFPKLAIAGRAPVVVTTPAEALAAVGVTREAA